VLNKVDLIGGGRLREPAAGWLLLSVQTGEGLADLTAAIEARAMAAAGASEAPVITQARHRQQIGAAVEALDAYLAGAPAELELRAEDLRRASAALGRITGRVDAEDVLAEIFGRFCIGK
jgi:tRNA modification GTPase